MGLFGEKSPEEKLTNELIGSWKTIGRYPPNFSISEKNELRFAVDSAFKNGKSCEEIQKVYDDTINEIINSKNSIVEENEINNDLVDDIDENQDDLDSEIDKINELLTNGDFESLYDNNMSFFYEVQILDSTPGIFGNRRHDQSTGEWRKCQVNFYQDKLIINKIGFWTGSHKGSQTVHFDRISNVDTDKGFLNTNVTIGLTGSDVVVLRNGVNSAEDVGIVLDNYLELWRQKVCKQNKNKESNISVADEIAKFHELKEKGILTEEEFEIKKKKLLQ